MPAPLELAEDVMAAGLLGPVLARFYIFTLVLVRMSGLMIVGPLFGTPVVPPRVRVFLIVALSVLVTPTVPAGEATWTLPPSLLEYVLVALGELSVGFALGLGVFTVLSGLQLAGELVDQQTGIALGEVFNPGLGTSSGLSGQMLYLFGTTVFLVMTPVGGHLRIMSALLETFRTLPVGEAFVSFGAIELLRDLVHQSLVLAVQAAAPVLAVMSLVALTLGFLGHTTPQINVLVIGFPVRATIALFVLALSFTGAARTVIDLLPVTIDQLRAALAAG
jgi:flagellar biosynthetic protein FliR